MIWLEAKRLMDPVGKQIHASDIDEGFTSVVVNDTAFTKFFKSYNLLLNDIGEVNSPTDSMKTVLEIIKEREIQAIEGEHC